MPKTAGTLTSPASMQERLPIPEPAARSSMPDNPSPEEIEELAARLTPAQLLVLPFYHDLKHELTNPDRIRVQTEYFWRRWAPTLGPTLTCLVITLRGYCYNNKLTQEKRDWCFPEQRTLAAEIGVSVDTIQRELKRPEAASFIRRQAQYRYNATNRTTRRIADRYHIAMDDPIAPDDEGKLAVAAAERILREAVENQAFFYRPQNATYKSRPVDPGPYTPQTAVHTATANCQSGTSTSKQDLNNVNVNALKKSPNGDLRKGGPAVDQQRTLESLLVEDVLGVTQDPHSTGFYRKLVRHFPADQVRALISETRQVIAEGRVNISAPGASPTSPSASSSVILPSS